MVYLDGKLVTDEVIDPGKHKFIGLFRSPNPPRPDGAILMCPCGRNLFCVEEGFSHYQMGHFDIPQYQTIEGNDGN